MMPRQSILLKILLPVIMLVTVWLLLRPASKKRRRLPRPAPWRP